MGKKSKRRQQSGGNSSSTARNNNNNSSSSTTDDDDAFLEEAIQRAAAEKKALDDAAVKQAAAAAAASAQAASRDALEGLEGFDRLQAVCNNLGVQMIPPPQQQRSQQRKQQQRFSGAWSHLSADEAHLMTQWEHSMDPSLNRPNMSSSATMKAMAITPEFVKGLPIGDWYQLVQRMQQVSKTVHYINSPPLKSGDYIEIIPGNNIKWGLVGQRGTIMDYFGDENKWGIEMDSHTLGPSLVYAGNLKRIKAGYGVGVGVAPPGQKWTKRRQL